jgi:hypothetical protein
METKTDWQSQLQGTGMLLEIFNVHFTVRPTGKWWEIELYKIYIKIRSIYLDIKVYELLLIYMKNATVYTYYVTV